MVMTTMLRAWERGGYTLTIPCRPSSVGNVLLMRSRPGMVPGMAERPDSGTILWPDAQAGPWAITVWWRVQYGAPVPVGLSIRSWCDGDETAVDAALPPMDADVEFPRVDGLLLRRLPVKQLAAGALTQIRSKSMRRAHELASEVTAGLAGNTPDLLQQDVDRVQRHLDHHQSFAPAPRGRDMGDDHYREVAKVYVDALATGKPTTAVAKHFQVEKSTAAKKVARARKRGFLPPTSGRGRAGRATEDL